MSSVKPGPNKLPPFPASRLIMSIVCLAGFGGFIGVATAVTRGATMGMDTAILLLARATDYPELPRGAPWLQEAMRDLTALGGNCLLTLIVVAFVSYLLAIKKYSRALFVCVTVVGATAVNDCLKIAFNRVRPTLFPHGSITYMASFPSGHSTMSAVVFLTLGLLLAEYQPTVQLKIYIISLSVLVIALVGISRIYLGVHWPTDVFAGWLGGVAWATGMRLFYDFYLRTWQRQHSRKIIAS